MSKSISRVLLAGVIASSLAFLGGCSSGTSTVTEETATTTEETTTTEESTANTTTEDNATTEDTTATDQGRPSMEDMFANLDEETKAKAQEILSQMNDGTITREDAEAQLAELGV
jgi:hypothetical protein